MDLSYSKIYLFVILLLLSTLFLFSQPQKAYARVDCSIFCDTDKDGPFCCYSYLCAGLNDWSKIDLSTCTNNIPENPPPNYCDTSNWKFNYIVCQSKMNTSAIGCDYRYSFQPYQCSAADSCVSGPYLNPGQCSASSYDGSNPTSACTTSSTRYKVCCNNDGSQPSSCSGGSHSGTCPSNSTNFCGFGSYPSCNSSACKAPKKCVASAPYSGDCIDTKSREMITDYYWDDGSGKCDSTTAEISDPSCTPITPTPPPEEPVTPPPPPGTTITPTSPPSLQCNQAYGTCGCVPGTGCQDGSQTDYRCCYRTCDLVKQQCITMFGQGRANTCDSTDPNIPDPKCITAANFNGLCKISGNQATFNVIGGRCPAANPKCSRADYTSGAHAGEAAWEAEAVPFSHSVFPNERFTWYVNGKSSSAICKISTKTQCGQEGCIVDEDCDSTYQCEDRCN